MEFIEKYRDLMEFIYFCSGPLMLIGIFIALLQIKYLKRDMSIRVERESLLLSLKILEDKLLEANKSFTSAHENNDLKNFPDFEGSIEGYHKASIKCENDWLEAVESGKYYKFLRSIYNCLSKLEILAQYVLSGICDESECYKLEGTTFVSYVKELKVYIAFAREEKDDPLYENILNLNKIWTERLEHEQLMKKRKTIDTELKSKISPKPLRVVGK